MHQRESRVTIDLSRPQPIASDQNRKPLTLEQRLRRLPVNSDLKLVGLESSTDLEVTTNFLAQTENLKFLHFDNCSYSDTFFEKITSALLANQGITLVSFSSSQSNDYSFSSRYSSSSSLSRTSQTHKTMTRKSCAEIIKLIQKDSFTCVELSEDILDKIGELDGVTQFVLRHEKTNLSILEIRYYSTNNKSINQLKTILALKKKDSTLIEIELLPTQGEEYILQILEVLKTNQSIKKCKISAALTERMIKCLIELLTVNQTLEHLMLGLTQYDNVLGHALAQAMIASRLNNVAISYSYNSNSGVFLFNNDIDDYIDLAHLRLMSSTQRQHKFTHAQRIKTHMFHRIIMNIIMRHKELETIECPYTSITNDELKELFDALSAHENLLEINLSNLKLDNCAMPLLIGFLKQHEITNLNISGNNFTDDAIVTFSEYLKSDHRLVVLNISHNPLGSVAYTALSSAIANNKSLITLKIFQNNYSAKVNVSVLNNFVKELSPNGALIELELQWPSMVQTGSSYGGVRSFQLPAQYTKFIQIHVTNKDNAIIAIKTGDLTKLREMMQKNVSPYVTDEYGNTLLHMAVKHQHISMIRYLIGELRVNQKIRNHQALTPKQLAEELLDNKNDDAKAKEILECFNRQPAPLTAKPKQSSLSSFIKRPLDTIPTPVDSNASHAMNVDDEAPSTNHSDAEPKKVRANIEDQLILKFYMAALNGQESAIKIMLEDNNIPVNSTLANGESALHAACKNGHAAAARLLISNGAIATTDLLGQTPLHFACDINNTTNTLEAVKALLSMENIQVNVVDQFGRSPLYCIAGNMITNPNQKVDDRDKSEIAWQLIYRGANPSLQVFDMELYIDGMTPLHKAAFRGQYKICKAFLSSHLLNINLQNAQGDTVLHIAVRRCYVDLVAVLLVQPEIDLKIRNLNNETVFDIIQSIIRLNGENEKTSKIKELLNLRNQKTPLVRSPGIQFAKSLTLFYSSRNGLLKLDDNQHSVLKSGMNSLSTGNEATASLTFVVRHPGEANSRRIITIDLQGNYFHQTMAWQERIKIGNGSDSRMRSRDALSRIQFRWNAAPNEMKTNCTNEITPGKALTNSGIETLFNNASSNPPFEYLFHHSEVGLCDFLENPETIRKIVDQLMASEGFVPNSKVYPVLVLRIHSKHYICANCEISLMGEQNPESSKFLKGMSDELSKRGCRLSLHRPLKMAVCVTADTPAKDMVRRTETDHHDIFVDLRADYSHLMLERTYQPQFNMMNFLSRKP